MRGRQILSSVLSSFISLVDAVAVVGFTSLQEMRVAEGWGLGAGLLMTLGFIADAGPEWRARRMRLRS